MSRISKSKKAEWLLAAQNGIKQVWDAAGRTGFDRMDAFPKSYDYGFDITRRKDLAGDIIASARILEFLANELMVLGFKPKVWDRDNLDYQYANGSVVVSFGMSRKGVHLYATTW